MRTLLFLATLVSLATPTAAGAQPRAKVTVAIYAPSIEFGSSAARLAYVQTLAKAIEQAAGVEVEARSYANLAALKRESPDFAIIDGPCYATNLGWRVLASATINGSTTRPYALYASTGTTMRALEGKRLAYIAAGCNDAGFVDHAMLASEVDAGFFAARVAKPDLSAAIAEVAAVRAAHAVFAPVGAAKNLTKVFDTGSVPNPAFVVVDTKLPAATVDRVASAVTGFGGSGAIGGWVRPAREIYTGFAARMARSIKAPVFAAPEPVRLDVKDVLVEPSTIRDHALVGVRHHFVRPRERME